MRTVLAMPSTVRTVVEEALGSVIVQLPHPCLSTDEGMAANADTAVLLALNDVRHLRTSEYVVATACNMEGQRVLLRAGHHDVAEWHREELEMAAAWATTGRAVAPVLPDLVATPHGAVSVWPFIEHDSALADHDFDALDAGRMLRELHAVASTPVFAARGWRAPGKIARRLLALEQRRPEHTGTWAALAADIARTSARVPPEDLVTIHGDYQPVNWLATPAGLRVVDFATSGLGPAAWDLTLLEQRCRTGWLAADGFWERFCDGYGVDPSCLDGTPAQHLRTLSHVVANLSHAPTATEFDAHLGKAAHIVSGS